MLKVFAVLCCAIAVPTFAQDLLDDYDPQAAKGISMRCWNNLKDREVEYRLKSEGLYMDNVLKEVDERRGNVVAKRQYSEWLVTTIIFDFDERIEVMTEEFAEGVSEEDARDRLLSLGYTGDFQELLSTVGKPQVTDCR